MLRPFKRRGFINHGSTLILHAAGTARGPVHWASAEALVSWVKGLGFRGLGFRI